MGSYYRLHQQSDKDQEDSVSASTAKVLYDDPLDLAILYTFILERLPEPPDDALKLMLSLTRIIYVYLYPVVRGLILHWYSSIFALFLAKDNMNVFVRYGIRRFEK